MRDNRGLSILLLAAALAAGLAAGGPARAARPNADVSCQIIMRVEGGRFTYRMEPGFSVLDSVRGDGPFRYDDPGGTVGFSCLRSQPLPEVDDVEVLQAGYELYVAGGPTGMRMIKLALADGRISHEVIGGALSGKEEKALSRILAGMQARLASAR